MKLSISCPDCGKHFRNIKPEMAGKKARCSCGSVVRLGPKGSASPGARGSQNGQKPVSSSSDPVMGDETLGKQLLGGGSLETGSAKSHPDHASQASSSGKRDSSDARIPEVPLTVSVSTQASSEASRRRSFEQTYCDLEDILDGVGDASPLTTRAPDDQPQYRKPDSTNPISAPSLQQQSLGFSTPGFIAAVGSATLAFWFGLFIVISKFQLVEWFFLGSFSMHLRSVYSITFGESDVPRNFGVIFMVLGWLIWSVAVGMVVISIGQFVNAFAKLLTRREPVGWTDGVNGTLGICAVFLLVAIVFSQVSLAKYENLALDVYERPFVEDGEHLDNVSLIRKDIEDRNRSFTISMLAVATVPMTVFGLSMVRLYTKSSTSHSSLASSVRSAKPVT